MSVIRLLAALLVGILASASARAGDGRPYAAVFGGGGSFNINNVNQVGTALFSDSDGGPLNVNAVGSTGYNGLGLVGVQIGHEWSGHGSCGDCCNDCCSGGGGWGLLPAVEFEGFYLGGTQRSDVNNPGTRLGEHRFTVTMPMDNWALLANAVVSVQANESIFPYVGIGIGTANVRLSGADSLQFAPPEAGVNHFDSNPNSSAWAFAAQAKVGVRLALTERAYVFTEYRFLYVGSTTQTFGSTVAPGHVATTPWTLHLGDIYHHLGVAGVGFSF